MALNTMNIRAYNESYYYLITDIYNQSKFDELENESHTFNLLPLTEEEVRLKELMESNIFVYDSSHVIAFGAFYKSAIRALFVHLSDRDKGVGKKLF
jgi:citrate lyase synthetase